MPRQPDGTFVRTNSSFTGPTTWQQQASSQDDTISSTRHDAHDQDMADGIADSLSRSGKGGMQADLDLGTGSLTNGSPTAGNALSIIPSNRTATRVLAIQALLAQGRAFDITDPQYGAVAEGSGGAIVTAEIQAAIDAAAALGGGVVWVPIVDTAGSYYRIDGPLYWKRGVILAGGGINSLIYNDAAEGVFPNTACLIGGTFTADSYTNVYTQTNINNVTAPASTIQATTATEAGRVAVGDVIVVTSGEYYDSSAAGGEVPLYVHATLVTSVDTGTGNIGLRDPIKRDLGSTRRAPRFFNPNESGKQYDGKPVLGSYAAGVFNMSFKSNRLFLARGGMLDCWMDHVWITAEDALYGNGFWRNRFDNIYFNAISASGSQQFLEFKLGSHDSIVDGFNGSITDAASTVISPIEFGESSRNCHLQNSTLDLGALAPSSAVAFADAQDCSVRHSNITALAVADRFVNFNHSTAQTPDDVKPENCGCIDVTFRGKTVSQYWAFNSGSGLSMLNHYLKDCSFYANISDRTGIFDGQGTEVVNNYHSDERFSNNDGIQILDAASSGVIRGNLNISRFQPSSAGLIADTTNNFIEQNTSKDSRDSRAAAIIDTSERTFSATTNTTINETTFPARSLRASDQIVIYVIGTNNGTAGEKIIELVDDTGVLATCTIAANDQAPWRIDGTIEIQANTAYASYMRVNPSNTSNLSDQGVRRTGLDLKANSRTFTLRARNAVSGTNIIVRTVRLEPRKPGMAAKLI